MDNLTVMLFGLSFQQLQELLINHLLPWRIGNCKIRLF
jgi:hypothetical protein